MGTEDEATDVEDVTGATKREGHQSDRARKSAEPARLARGDTVGRYTILDVLGEGGMGVVYSAYDPELDRRVAIKLLQGRPAAGSNASGDQAWLLREAQALARLSHPNVIAVHDVGTLPGDRVFIAIELVQGVTLRAWMKQPHGWREVRRVMLEAGAGLAAAHGAGLVHRDFKPDNVLVGDDGRVRVMDFGLARLDSEEPSSRSSDSNIELRSPLSEHLTVAGSVVGTPAYMAPELYEGSSASSRSDEFAFGVTLYEALFRARPYDKKAFVAPRAKDLAPKQPPRSDVPPRLARTAMRAIALDPRQRFPSMAALLAELSIDPTAAKRRAIIAAAAIAAVGALLVGTTLLTGGSNETPALYCKDADRRLAGVWDAKTRQDVMTAFGKTTRPFKDHAFASVAASLDRYATQWTTAATQSCEATRIRGEQTEDVLSLREDCLNQRLQVMRSFVGLLAQVDDFAIDKANKAAVTFTTEEDVARCADIATLKAPAAISADLRAKADPAFVRLADARAGLHLGNTGRAINASEEAIELGEKLKLDGIVSEAKLVLGMALLQVGNMDYAAQALAASVWAALRSRRDDIAAMASMHAALVASQGHHDSAKAQLWSDLGDAVRVRTTTTNIELEIQSFQIAGVIAGNQGDLIKATTAHEKAFALSIQKWGREDARIGQSEQLLATTFTRAGDYAKAVPHFEHVLAVMLKTFDKDHPDLALIHTGLGSGYHYLGEHAKSHAAFNRATEIRERVFGPNSPVLITTLNNHAELYRDELDHVHGLPLVERAFEITKKTVGKAHPYYGVVTATLGEMLILAGRVDEARTHLDESVKLADRFKSPYLPQSLIARARLARLDKKWADAAALDERAIAVLEEKVGKEAPDLWQPLTGLALSKIAQNKPVEAKPLLERALAIGEKAHVPAAMLAPTRDALAKL